MSLTLTPNPTLTLTPTLSLALGRAVHRVTLTLTLEQVAQRTVSYVWHLSQSWRPEWGGALYWAQNDHAVPAYPADPNPNP